MRAITQLTARPAPPREDTIDKILTSFGAKEGTKIEASE
eukprot:COSAG01_NODE_43267_length_431_cov_1.638554_1_plen_38_part_01